jgi:hypothetical protein
VVCVFRLLDYGPGWVEELSSVFARLEGEDHLGFLPASDLLMVLLVALALIGQKVIAEASELIQRLVTLALRWANDDPGRPVRPIEKAPPPQPWWAVVLIPAAWALSIVVIHGE